MSILHWALDRISLQPTNQFVDPESRTRLTVPVNDYEVEIWKSSTVTTGFAKLLIIKFPGTAGRAERSTVHPLEVWQDIEADVWAVNHCGYGGSHGPASLRNFTMTCDAVWQQARRVHDGPMIVTGNSLGCLSALYMAARFDVAGIILRNGFGLAQLIAGRKKYTWTSLGVAHWVARCVPLDLDSILNAQQCTSPALYVRSAADRLVPARFQREVFDALAGPKREFLVLGADHADRIPESQTAGYIKSLRWLRDNLPNS